MVQHRLTRRYQVAWLICLRICCAMPGLDIAYGGLSDDERESGAALCRVSQLWAHATVHESQTSRLCQLASTELGTGTRLVNTIISTSISYPFTVLERRMCAERVTPCTMRELGRYVVRTVQKEGPGFLLAGTENRRSTLPQA
eukprot:1648472-Rhodomonas_salina.3